VLVSVNSESVNHAATPLSGMQCLRTRPATKSLTRLDLSLLTFEESFQKLTFSLRRWLANLGEPIRESPDPGFGSVLHNVLPPLWTGGAAERKQGTRDIQNEPEAATV